MSKVLRQQLHYDDDPILAKTLDLQPDQMERFDVFVMEKCGGSLKDDRTIINIIGIIGVINQLLAMAELLKTKGICHNDVKPSNILYKIVYKSNGKPSIELKLSDFGMSDRWGGTPGWSPHDFTKDREPGDDFFSFGLIILYLLCDDETLFYILRDQYLIDYHKHGQTKYRSPPLTYFREKIPEIEIILELIDVRNQPNICNIKAVNQFRCYQI